MSAHSLGENREKQTREYSKKGLYAFLAKIVLGLSTLEYSYKDKNKHC